MTPWLPDWLPELQLHGIVIGQATVDLRLIRHDETTSIETTSIDTASGSGFEVISDQCPAPLWGVPTRAPDAANDYANDPFG